MKKTTKYGVILFVVIVLIAGFFAVKGSKNPPTEDLPKEFGKIEVDDDGEEVLGKIEEGLYNDDRTINLDVATFDPEKAKEIGANRKYKVKVAEKELDETVINLKTLYIRDNGRHNINDLFNYILNYTSQYMIDVPSDLMAYVKEDGNAVVDIDSSIYKGLMTKYFPNEACEDECLDFMVDADSDFLSADLLLDNAKSVLEVLGEEENVEVKDVYYIYLNEPGYLEGITDANGKYIK